MDVHFHRLAEREYLAALARYERLAGLGDDFRLDVDRAAARIASQPDRWPVYRAGFRRVRLRRFPFTLYYRIDDPTHVTVVAVAHAKRRPGYWLRRGSG